MERLTERDDYFQGELDEIAFINPDDPEGLYNLRDIVEYAPDDEHLYKIANRLCQYEETDLTPAEVAEMKERATPKEPINIANKVGIVGGNCPACHGLVFKQYAFCELCGQALKWPELPKEEQK